MILDFNALRGFEYGFVAWLTKTLRFCKCHVVRNIYRGILRNSETKIDSKLKKDSSRLAYNDACLACNDILESTQNQDFQSKDNSRRRNNKKRRYGEGSDTRRRRFVRESACRNARSSGKNYGN